MRPDTTSRIPKNFTLQGFDVLNINRAGYGGNPIPSSTQPILDAIPIYTNLILKTYNNRSNGIHGIVLIGHSLGAATSLSIAAFEGHKLPLLGVSAFGIIPTKEHPPGLKEMLKKDPRNPRFVVEASPEATETFMGPMEVLDLKMLESPAILSIFEPGQLSIINVQLCIQIWKFMLTLRY